MRPDEKFDEYIPIYIYCQSNDREDIAPVPSPLAGCVVLLYYCLLTWKLVEDDIYVAWVWGGFSVESEDREE